MNIKLYEHQTNFLDHAGDKCGIWHACGTGKTITGLAIASARSTSCLVICPKGVKSKWEKAVKDFPNTRFYVITKEEFRRDWADIQPFDGVIIDEAHHFSSTKSQMHKSLLKYLKQHRVKYIWPMTATPYRRDPFNIYALAKILGHNWDFMKFRYQFYRPQYFGPRMVWIAKTGIEKEIASLVRSIGDVVSFEQCGDLPEITHEVEEFDMTKDQLEAVDALDLVEANPLTRYLRIHQICSGIGAKSNKLERIMDLAEETPKLAIFCRYTEQIESIRDALAEAGHRVFVINGQTKNKDLVAQWVEAADRCVVIMQMDSAEGFELPSVHVACFASMSYSYLAYEQSLGRFIRINKQNKPKMFIYLITKESKGIDSIDRAVYDNLMAKQDFSLEIYSKQRSRK